MKRPVLTTIILLVIMAIAYIGLYRTSYLRWPSPGGKPSPQIVIAGIDIPYNKTTKRLFSFFFSPQIDHAVARRPIESVEGTISRIDFSKSELVISFMKEKPDGTGGVIIGIPKGTEAGLASYSRGDHVQATYGSRTTEESPFGWGYELKSINRLYHK